MLNRPTFKVKLFNFQLIANLECDKSFPQKDVSYEYKVHASEQKVLCPNARLRECKQSIF